MSKPKGLLLYDAHVHLPSARKLKNYAAEPVNSRLTNLRCSIINGTSPNDWLEIIDFAEGNPRVLPAIGLHPLEVKTAPENWKKVFLQILNNNSVSAIGEIGLDRRNKSDVVEKQLDAFCWQMEQASVRDLPVSIHCVKATGLLMDTLRTHSLPSRGLHLHAYNGSLELIPELVEMGAYFSFAARQLERASEKVQNCICAVPIRRLLIETDAIYGGNLSALYNCYTTIARMREMSLNELSVCVAENFKTYYLID